MIRLEDRLKQYEPFFNKWRLHDSAPLGSGSSGVVYSIYSGELEAALKVIPIPRDEAELSALQSQLGSEERVRKELIDKYNLAREEIDIMKKLWGESHLVCFEDHYIVDRTDTFGWDVLIRMEKLIRIDHFLREDNLKRFGYKRDRELVLRIWDDLLLGLQVCQHNSIVHLDIKPENIFYAPGGDHFKLGDFGVSARSVGGGKVMERMIVGTEDYMAPEVHDGAGGDTRSDIYSLALVIYQLFNGDRLPFMPAGTCTQEDRRRGISKRLSGEKVPRIKGVSADTMELLQRCLEFSPANRYQTVEEVKRDLRKIVYGEENRGSSKTLPVLIAVASLGLAGVLVMLGITATRNSGELPAPTPTPALTAMEQQVVETSFVEDAPETATEAPTDAPTEVPVTEAPTQLLMNFTTPEITEEPTLPPEGDGVTVNGDIHFASLSGGGAVGWLDAQIFGDVNLSLNGEEGGVYRISENRDNLPEANVDWPEDGLYFIVSDDGSADTQSISLACDTDDGENLYAYETSFYWLTADSGARVFMTGEAPEAERAAIALTARDFELAGELVGANQGYTFRGTAEPGVELRVMLNQTEIATVTATEMGQWAAELPEELLAAEISCTVTAAYTDGEGEEAQLMRFTYDPGVSCTLDADYRQGDAQLSGVTDPGATVTLVLPKGEGDEVTANDDGVFTFDMTAYDLRKGDIFKIVATDAAGNALQNQFTVGQKAELAQITLNELARTCKPGDTITVTGTAEPGETVFVIWQSLAEESDSYGVEALVGDDGAFGLDVHVPEVSGSDSLLVSYESGDELKTIDFTLDGECSVEFRSELTEDSAAVSLAGDPGAQGTAWLNADSNTAIQFNFDDNGLAEVDLSGLNLRAGDVLSVSAVDALGNRAETRTATVGYGEYEALTLEVGFSEGALVATVHGRPGAEVCFEVLCQNQSLSSENRVLGDKGEEVATYTGDYLEETYTVRVSYANGEGEAVEKSYDVDLTAPDANADLPVFACSYAITGATEPGTKLTLLRGEEALDQVSADDSGDYAFPERDFAAGTYSIVTEDAFGNSNAAPFTVRLKTGATFDSLDLPRTTDGAYLAGSEDVESVAFSGTAEPGTSVVLSFGASGVEVDVDENGRWSQTCGLDASSERIRVTVGYDGEVSDEIEIVCDLSCALSVSTSVVENTAAIEGTSEPGAVIYLFRKDVFVTNSNGERVETIADESGRFTLPLNDLDQPLTMDETLTVRAFDAAQNQGEAELTVGKVERQPIVLSVDPEPNAEGWVNANTLSIRCTGEPGAEIALRVSLAGGAQEETIALDASGEFEQTLTPLAEGQCEISAAYADGYAAESADSLSFAWDATAPALRLDSDTLTVTTDSVKGTTEPGAQVEMFINGASQGTKTAEDGSFAYKNLMLYEGDEVTLLVADAAGNAREVSYAVQAALPSAAGAFYVDKTSLSAGESLTVNGMVVCLDSDWVWIDIMSGEQSVTSVRLETKQPMTDDEVSEALASLGQQLDVNAGYWIDQEIALGDWASAGGTFTVRLRIDSYPDPSYVESDQATFEVAASEQTSAGCKPYVGESYAIGLDAQQQRELFDNSCVVLTGWFYGGADETYSIERVVVAPALTPLLTEEIALEEVAEEAIPGEQGVCYMPRSAADAAPVFIARQLPDVAPSNDQAGFVISLDLSHLEPGDYIVTLRTRVDGPYTETASLQISIGDGQPLPPGIAESIADGWYGDSLWPTRLDGSSSSNEIARVQQKLEALGLLESGYAEGQLDAPTLQAVYSFQSAANRLLGATLYELNPEDAAAIVDEATLALMETVSPADLAE